MKIILDTNSFYLISTPIAVVAFLAFRIIDVWKP